MKVGPQILILQQKSTDNRLYFFFDLSEYHVVPCKLFRAKKKKKQLFFFFFKILRKKKRIRENRVSQYPLNYSAEKKKYGTFVQTCLFFVRFPCQKRFSHSKLKKYVPEFYTMYMSFQIFVAICGMKCRVCTHNVPFVSSASARPEFEYRSQSPADTVIVLHEIYFRHDKPS